MVELLPQGIGWYGKLPSRGDFVGRGLPRVWQRTWDEWLQRSLAQAAQQLGAATLRARLRAMPHWQCMVLPTARGQPVWCGIVGPSQDRVGRTFPLLLVEAYEEASLDPAGLAQLQARALSLSDWLYESSSLTAREFESGVTQLGTLPWRCEAPRRARVDDTVAGLRSSWPAGASFWWCTEPLTDVHDPLAEAWPPREALILDLLGPAHAVGESG
jgi:type VI secretion system protein ImpM